MSKINVDTWEPESGTAATLMASGDTVTVPSGAELDIASGATLDVNGTIDVTGATVTGLTTGKVLQVVQSVKTDTATTTVAAGTFADIAGTDQDAAGSVWCVKITPAATSSKILVSWDCQIGSATANNAVIFKLFRNAVEPFLADTDGSRVRASTSGTISGAIDWVSGISGQYLDSPSLTSEITYKIQWSQPATASIYLNRAGTDTDNTAHTRGASTITVVEIAA